MKYNKDTFFYVDNGKIIACVSSSQDYYEVDPEYFTRIVKRSAENSIDAPFDNVDNELISNNIFIENLSNDELPWEGDPISYYSHQGTRIHSLTAPRMDADEVCKELIELACAVKEVPPKHVPNYLNEIKLPEPNLDLFKESSLFTAVKNRKTSRNFVHQMIDIEHLASLLYFSFGPIHGKTWEDFEKLNIPALGNRRSSPSAAGMQGCDAYLVVLNGKGIERGIYLYSGDSHSLYELKSKFDDMTLIAAVDDQFWAKDLSAGIFLVNDMRRTWIKDKKARGYLAAYLEAGHLSQTILLSATALGIHTWITGTFKDDIVNEKLQLLNSPCFASFFVGLGFGSNSSIPEKFIETIERKNP